MLPPGAKLHRLSNPSKLWPAAPSISSRSRLTGPVDRISLSLLHTAIRRRDKLLLILSEHSIKSGWVEDEVTAGFEEERKRGQIVLFPVRLDEAVMETKEAWAAKLRARLIGDFRRWKNHDAYQRSFQRMLRNLTKERP